MGDPLDQLLAETDPHSAMAGGLSATNVDPLDQLLAETAPSTAKKPVPVGRQALNAGPQIYNAFRHPLDAIAAIGKGARDAFYEGFVAPVSGSHKSDIDYAAAKIGTPYGENAPQGEENRRAGMIAPGTQFTAKTPGVVTQAQMLKGGLNTGANIALPGVGGAIASRAANAGLGAINDTEQPIRGAVTGLVIGEALHQLPKIGNIGDVSEGMVESGVQGLKETLAEEAPLWGPARRPAYSLPMKQRPALEPSADVVPASAGGEPMSALDKLIASRSYLEPRGRLDEVGEIGRRPVETLPMGQRPPVEPGPEVVPQSFGGRVRRRPGGEIPVEEAVPTTPELSTTQALDDLLAEGPAQGPERPLETQSFGGLQEGVVQPLASATPGSVELQPGVARKVNKAFAPEPITETPLPKDLPPIVESPAPEPIPAQSFEGVKPVESPAPDPRPSDILNVAKLNLGDKTAQQRIVDQLEQHRALRDSQRQTFQEADVNRAEIVKELTASDPKALDVIAAKRLSGEELLARRDVVRQNDQLISELSKSLESKTLTVAEHEQAQQLLQKAVEHNDALLSDLVLGSSQKGRDLNLLRRIANRDLSPETWLTMAKRSLGDAPLTDEIHATIHKLAQAAADACAGGTV